MKLRVHYGKKRTTISWSKLSSKPSEWILEECYPEGFAWADPSKIRKSEVFRLLNHWRQREKDGLTLLIWNPSCELFNDDVPCSRGIGIQKQRNTPSTSDSSPSSSPDPSPSEKDSEDEDFAADMAKIQDSDSDNPYSDPPSPSPLPNRRVSNVPEEIGGLMGDTPPSVPDDNSSSSKLINVSIAFAFTDKPHSTPS